MMHAVQALGILLRTTLNVFYISTSLIQLPNTGTQYLVSFLYVIIIVLIPTL